MALKESEQIRIDLASQLDENSKASHIAYSSAVYIPASFGSVHDEDMRSQWNALPTPSGVFEPSVWINRLPLWVFTMQLKTDMYMCLGVSTFLYFMQSR